LIKTSSKKVVKKKKSISNAAAAMDYKKFCQMVEKKKSPSKKIASKGPAVAPQVREKSKENTNREVNQIVEGKKKSIIKVPKALILKFQEKVQAQ
jgi:hypothetical protein